MMNNKEVKDDVRITEIPTIVIERDNDTVKRQRSKRPVIKILKYAAGVLCLLLGVIVVIEGYRLWSYYYDYGMTVSVSSSENIAKLKAAPANERAEVVLKSDSILGVGLDIYAIHGLQGSIEFQEPDTADTSVYLYCRSADFTADGRYLGTLVAEGRAHQSDNSRLGYMAMANGNNVIGISRFDDVKDYVADHGGSFFRQFVLVSNGELPLQFHLHGKVERCAIGRIGERLFYVTTRHKETLWSFADALREYGFIDAIYITGGTDYSYYRDSSGIRHDIHDIARYPHKKWQGITPWLVFRKR